MLCVLVRRLAVVWPCGRYVVAALYADVCVMYVRLTPARGAHSPAPPTPPLDRTELHHGQIPKAEGGHALRDEVQGHHVTGEG